MFVNGMYPRKSLKHNFFGPGKTWNLVLAGPGKSWKLVVHCQYEHWVGKYYYYGRISDEWCCIKQKLLLCVCEGTMWTFWLATRLRRRRGATWCREQLISTLTSRHGSVASAQVCWLAYITLLILLPLLLLHLFSGLCSMTYWVSRYQKDKSFWILLKLRWKSGIGICWTICKSFASCSRQTTIPVLHQSVIYGPDAFAFPATQPQLKSIEGKQWYNTGIEKAVLRVYSITLSQKNKASYLLLSITLPDADRFTRYFHWQTR